MKLWIALGIAVVLGAFIYMNQPENQPTQPAVVQTLPQGPTPPSPRIVQKPRRAFPRAKAIIQDDESTINEANFVEAVEEPQEEPQAPDTLRYKNAQKESTPLMQLTNFEQKKNRNSMVTLTYGSDPKANFKIEDREVRRRRAFVASEGDQ